MAGYIRLGNHFWRFAPALGGRHNKPSLSSEGRWGCGSPVATSQPQAEKQRPRREPRKLAAPQVLTEGAYLAFAHRFPAAVAAVMTFPPTGLSGKAVPPQSRPYGRASSPARLLAAQGRLCSACRNVVAAHIPNPYAFSSFRFRKILSSNTPSFTVKLTLSSPYFAAAFLILRNP